MNKSVIALAFALLAFESPAVLAQKLIPNPLVRPPADAKQAGEQFPVPAGMPQSPGGPAGKPMPSSNGVPGAEVVSTEGLPLLVQERTGSLFVSAIVNRTAILRSIVGMPQQSLAAGSGTAAPASGGSTQPGVAVQQPANGGAGAPGYRAVSYTVQDGQVVNLVDTYRVLATVEDTTVVLTLLPDAESLTPRRRVVFRGSVDSVIAAPPVPTRASLEAPDGGLDGRARRDAAATSLADQAGVRAAQPQGQGVSPGAPSPGSLAR